MNESCAVSKQTHHPTSSHFHLLILALVKVHIHSQEEYFFLSTPPRGSLGVKHHLQKLEWFRTSAANLKSTVRNPWVNHIFVVFKSFSYQTVHTTRERWSKFISPDKLFIYFYFAINSQSLSYNAHPVNINPKSFICLMQFFTRKKFSCILSQGL